MAVKKKKSRLKKLEFGRETSDEESLRHQNSIFRRKFRKVNSPWEVPKPSQYRYYRQDVLRHE